MEQISSQPEKNNNQREQKIKEVIALAIELSESRESFPFPGLDPAVYSKLKASEERFPGHVTPIDELIERFKKEGIKVVLGEHPESGNVFILPAQSNDIGSDSIFPRHLPVSKIMNEKLKRLVLMDKNA
jgi:hypothetical protein